MMIPIKGLSAFFIKSVFIKGEVVHWNNAAGGGNSMDGDKDIRGGIPDVIGGQRGEYQGQTALLRALERRVGAEAVKHSLVQQ